MENKVLTFEDNVSNLERWAREASLPDRVDLYGFDSIANPIAKDVNLKGKMISEVGSSEYPALVNYAGGLLGVPRLRTIYLFCKPVDYEPGGNHWWPTYAVVFQVDVLLSREEVERRLWAAGSELVKGVVERKIE